MSIKSIQKTRIKQLPKTGKENQNKKGQRIPLEIDQAERIQRKPFTLQNVQRRAYAFYSTDKVGDTCLILRNEVKGRAIRINFIKDLFGYIKIDILYKEDCHYLMTEPKNVRDFYIKLVRKGIL